jgi:predicted CXXCH cytochrome family protein
MGTALVAIAAALVTIAAAPTDPSLTAYTRIKQQCELAWAPREKTTSRDCLLCHDGSVAKGTDVRLQATGDSRGANHAVGMLYANTRRGLRLRSAPAKELVLVDGRVECTTCHAPRGFGAACTALPNEGSALCLACHMK